MQLPNERIASRQNPLIVLTAKLADRKHREREGLFRFDGKKLFLEALLQELPLVAVLLRDSAAKGLVEAAAAYSLPQGCRAVLVPDELFDRISEERSPEGVICLSKRLERMHQEVDAKSWGESAFCKSPSRILFLESVRDPGNLGTIIRVARAFGASALVLSADCADIYNPRVLRAAMGTLFGQPVFVAKDFVEVVRLHARYARVFAATLTENAARLGEIALLPSDAVLVGNEGHGLSEAVIAAATDTVYIPMESGVESLNAGVAASVLLWELYRGGRHG
ncbi:MAG: RNA methyltransferase [Clostridia bacterium]|nr:RNA methyltransferase [Clostridia bacterium]